jgi:glucosyl-dolichyl phosphate glucuronosyltransferase
MSPKLTIVVCTYNRSDWLPGCLSSLESQCVEDSVEVLIIDNNSSDATSSIAHGFTDRLPNFKYIFEGVQGLSHARNRGFKEARGQLVAYMDDDAKANPGWIKAIIHFFETHPDASGVGGQHKAFSLVPIPDWFPKEYGSRCLGEETRLLQKGEWISGTNMVFKKSALIEVGGFVTTIGMTGETVSYGEETHLTLKMLERGMQIYYCAEMCVDHAILPYKLKLSWLLRSNFANGYDGVTTFNYTGNAITFIPRLARAAKRALTLLLRSKERYFKTRLYRSLAPLCWELGFFVKLVGW